MYLLNTKLKALRKGLSRHPAFHILFQSIFKRRPDCFNSCTACQCCIHHIQNVIAFLTLLVSRLSPHVKPGIPGVVSLTGISMGQSSDRHSLVTQCRKTVDIFWFLCLTKRNTSKAKRPIWLFPFSNTVVCGSLSQLRQRGRETSCHWSLRQGEKPAVTGPYHS